MEAPRPPSRPRANLPSEDLGVSAPSQWGQVLAEFGTTPEHDGHFERDDKWLPQAVANSVTNGDEDFVRRDAASFQPSKS